MRTLQAYTQAVGTQIGVGLGSALRHVIILLNTMMKYLLRAAQAFATFMQTIFGKYKGGASGIAVEGLGDAADYADDLGSAAGDAADGLGSAADSAKQLKKDLSVLPFDELNQLNKDREDASSGSGSGGSGGSGAGGGAGIGDGLLDWGDLTNGEGGLPEAISAWAQQIQAAFKGHDWNLLGQIVANGLNKGLQKVYDLLDPKTVAEKVDPWINAFTTSFNSFIKWFDFNLLGKTVGRGINDVVHILNTAIEGIDWIGLGTQIANGMNGLFEEVDWDGLGNLIGNKLMILWNTLNGVVHGFHWSSLGLAVSNFFNGVFERVNFTTIGDTIATGLNGAFDSLAVFTATFNWQRMVNNMVNGINKFISGFEWTQNGMALNEFLKKLVAALESFLDGVDWEGLGQGIADFLSEIEWGIHLRKVAKAIVTALGELLKGLCSTTEGKVAVGIATGIGLIRFANSSFGGFVGNLTKALFGKSFKDLIKELIKNHTKNAVEEVAETSTVKTAAKTAGESIGKSFASSFSTFCTSGAGMALIEAGAFGLTLAVAKKFSEAWDEARGGNGVLTDFGTGIQDYIDNLTTAHALTKEQQQTLFDLKESYEDMGATAGEAVQGTIDKMVELGVPMGEATELAWQMVGAGEGQEEVMRMIAASAQEASDKIGEYNGVLGETNVSVGQANQDFYAAIQNLIDLKNAAGESSSEYQYVLEAFGQTMGSATTAGEAYQKIIGYLEDVGIDASEFNKIISEEYGYAVGEASTHTTTATKNWAELGSVAKGSASDINESVENIKNKFSEMQENATEKVNSIKSKTEELIEKWRSAGNATSEYAKTTKSNMEDTATSVSDYKNTADTSLDDNSKKFGDWQSLSIGHMVTMIAKMAAVAQAAQNMAEVSSGYADNMVGKFQTAFSSIGDNARNMVEQFTSAMSSIENTVSTTMSNIHSLMSIDLSVDGYNAAQSFANGFQSVHIPVPYMYVSRYDYVDLGNGGMYIPSFSVAWYKKGGLFMGGNGQMIGIAEDGRDEAVLPLEDRRAMSRIGSAIADASGNNGGMNSDLADRIAEKIADVLINTRSDDDRTPMNYVELKVDSEVLARAVTRGQQKLDYRNNPTAQLSY